MTESSFLFANKPFLWYDSTYIRISPWTDEFLRLYRGLAVGYQESVGCGMITKSDLILIGSILIAACILWSIYHFSGHEEGSFAKITVDGELYGIYSLEEEQEICIGDTNVCRIEEGSVKMVQADCPDQLCIHQHPASKEGEMIVCLPNKVVIEVTEGEDGSGP